MKALLLAVLLASPASAGRLCGRVSALGGPVPMGLLTLTPDRSAPKPGATERSFVRFRGGKFCLEGVADGAYVLAAAPLGLAEPAVEAKVAAPSENVELVMTQDEPAADWTTIEARVAFPKAEGAKPASAFAAFWILERGYRFARFESPAGGGERAVVVRVPPGRLGAVLVDSPGLAVYSLTPPFSVRNHDSTQYRPAQTVSVKIRLKPASRLSVRALRPDGAAYAPYQGEDPSRRSRLMLTVANMPASQEFFSFADEQGVVETEVAEGFWVLQPVGFGEGFTWAPGAASLRWLAAGKPNAFDLPLAAASVVALSADKLPLAPFWQTSYSDHNPKDRWVLGFPAGSFKGEGTARFSTVDEAPFALVQGEKGGWVSNAKGERVESTGARAPAGLYDLYVVESHRWLEFPWMRILAARPGVRLPAGERAELEFRKKDLLAHGEGSVRGSVKSRLRASLEDLRRAGSFHEMLTMIDSVVNLYDEQGRFHGVAVGNFASHEFDAALEALDDGDLPRLEKVFFGKPRPFGFKSLAPGRYRAEVVAYGYPPRSYSLEIGAGEPARLDADLDAEAKP